MNKNKKNRSLECFICHQIFQNKVSNLRRHIQLHDCSILCFKCLECEKTYQNKSNLKIHWKTAHSRVGSTPQMTITSRKSKNLRSVQHIAVSPSGKNTPSRNMFSGLAKNIQTPVFGESPNLLSKWLNFQALSTKSPFGHISFGANLPSFNMLDSNRVKLRDRQKINSCTAENVLRVQKTLPYTPDILKAVGVFAKELPPKCYTKKKNTLSDTRYETTCEIVFDANPDFGRINWEAVSSEIYEN